MRREFRSACSSPFECLLCRRAPCCFVRPDCNLESPRRRQYWSVKEYIEEVLKPLVTRHSAELLLREKHKRSCSYSPGCSTAPDPKRPDQACSAARSPNKRR